MPQKNSEKKKLSAASIICIVLCVLLLPILVTNLTLITKSVVNKDAVPTVGGMAPMIVLTDSMAPGIESGDMIVIREVDPAELKEGDAIAFFDPSSRQNAVVTHRIVEVIETSDGIMFRTKGDANNAPDPSLVSEEKVVGIWAGTVIRGAGSVAMFIQSTPGLILCVAVPIILLIAVELLRRRKFETKEQATRDALLSELEELRALKAEKDAAEEKAAQAEPEAPAEIGGDSEEPERKDI